MYFDFLNNDEVKVVAMEYVDSFNEYLVDKIIYFLLFILFLCSITANS